MTSGSPSADPPRPDDEDAPGAANGAGPDPDDWWDGAVDLAGPPEEPTADPATADEPATAAGNEASADGADDADGADGAAGAGGDGSGGGRSRWLVGTAAVVVVAGVSIGLLAARGDDGSGAATNGGGSEQGGPGGGRSGFGPGTQGSITDLDADASTFVVETSSQGSIEVSTTADTTISETVEGSPDDLSEGDSVLVVGTAADDGGTIAADQVVASSDGDLVGGPGAFGTGGGPAGGDLPQPPDGASPGGTPPEGFDPQQGGPGGAGGAGGPGGGQPAGGFTTGTIDSIDDGSISVRTADDETVTVTLSSATTVLLSRELSFDDLAPGDEVTVTGETDGDTVAAQAIRRGDVGFGFGGARPQSDDGTT